MASKIVVSLVAVGSAWLLTSCALLDSASTSSPAGEQKTGKVKAAKVEFADQTTVQIHDPDPGTEFVIDVTDLPMTTTSVSDDNAVTEVSVKIENLVKAFDTRDLASGEKAVVLPEKVVFDFGKAELLPGAKTSLDKLAELITLTDKKAIKIVGHTDSVADDAVNDALSQQRADAVKKYLVSKGIKENILQATGKGEREPMVPNASPDGTDLPDNRAKNRRVEVIIPGLTTKGNNTP